MYRKWWTPRLFRILPNIKSEAGIDNWKVELQGEGGTVIGSESGKGSLTDAVTFNLVPAGLSKIASFKTLTADVEVKDKEGDLRHNTVRI